METRKRVIVGVWVVVLVALTVLTGYYLNHQGEGREPTLVGDALCGSLVSESAQDDCCTNLRRDVVVIQCAGSWRYITGMRQCQYLCENELPLCNQEAKDCSRGAFVNRNASNECRFDSCP